MTKLEALRNLALDRLGWLGEYEYHELCIMDQLDIDRMVKEMELDTKRSYLLQHSLVVLREE